MIRLTFLLLLLFFANETFSQKRLIYKDNSFLYTLIRDSTLWADSVNYFCPVKAITIQMRTGGKTFQTIYPEENSTFCSFPEDEIFIVEDINFDGYNDIRLLQFIPAGPNVPYYYWTFNPKTNKFQRQKDFEEITSPQFDIKKRLIYSYWRASGHDHGSSTYKIINDKPTLIKVEEEKEEDGKIVSTVKRRVNGKMKLVSKTIGKAE